MLNAVSINLLILLGFNFCYRFGFGSYLNKKRLAKAFYLYAFFSYLKTLIPKSYEDFRLYKYTKTFRFYPRVLIRFGIVVFSYYLT